MDEGRVHMSIMDDEGRMGRRLLVGQDALGNRYILVCFDDGGYAIARNGVLMGEHRWDRRGVGMCLNEFLRLTGQAARFGVGETAGS